MCWNFVGVFVKCFSKHYLLLKDIALLCFAFAFALPYRALLE